MEKKTRDDYQRSSIQNYQRNGADILEHERELEKYK